MRFLADAGLSPKTVEFLKHLGHEATHVRELGLERARDSELVERARVDGSVIVTFDLDFGDIFRGLVHVSIAIRSNDALLGRQSFHHSLRRLPLQGPNFYSDTATETAQSDFGSCPR